MDERLLVWLFQTGEPLHIDSGNERPMRAMNLANSLVQKGHKVVLWSASFNHLKKKFRGSGNEIIQVSDSLQIRLVDSSGYKRNIGLGRLVDHALLALNLKKILRAESQMPDVAFVGYPPIEAAAVFTNWLVEKKIPVMLDVKDQWPRIFIDPLPGYLKPLGSFVIWPYTYLARQVMRKATCLSAMADGFLDWSLHFAGRNKTDNDAVYPLTTPTGQVTDQELEEANFWWDDRGVKADDVSRFYFAGSFSTAFNFTPVRNAALAALENGDKIQFVLCGEGDSVLEVKSLMSGLTNVIFPGWIDRPKIEALAGRSKASLAPYRSTQDFMISIPNKIIDSLSLGKPILSSLKGEVEALIDNYRVGLVYETSHEHDLYNQIKTLAEDQNRQYAMSKNARKLYSERFAFDKVYGSLVTHLERLAAASDLVEVK